MKERILIVLNKNKLSISLAYKNKSLFNTRILTPLEFANELLIRSSFICEKQFISKQEELVYYKSLIEKQDYFKTSKLADIKNINETINTIRSLVIDDEENSIKDKLEKGIFKEKNKALYEVYKAYIKKINEDNKIDAIGLIRYAINNAKKIETEVITLSEYALKPLEKQLLNKSNNYKVISIFDLYEVEHKNKHIESYKNYYGSSNEVASIIDDVYRKDNVDQCVIACADYPTYSQIFYDYASKYNIDITFKNGISVINSYPGKLLQQYYNWSNDKDFGWKPFNELIGCSYFNFELLNSLVITDNEKEFKRINFYEYLAKLRLTNDYSINKERVEKFKKSISRSDINDNDKLDKYVEGFEIIAKELALPIDEFINKYVVLRNTNSFVEEIDKQALREIINELKLIISMNLEISDDVIKTLLRKSIYRQNNKPGFLHVTTIKDALYSLRDNLYVCGLSSLAYPGSAKENPLLLDDDLNAFDCDELTSAGKIKEKRDALFNLIDLASSLENKIYLSYAGLNVSELKINNASSLMFEIYKQEYGVDKKLSNFKDGIINVDYFEPNLSSSRLVGKAYNESKKIVYKAIEETNNNRVVLDIGKYSPSALNTFFNCKKKFFYQNLLKINVEDDYDPYEVINASEQGTLVHALMEYLSDHKMSKEEFVKLAGEVFDEYMNISVPIIKEKTENTKQEFIQMLENGWQMDNDNRRDVFFKEEDKNVIHSQTGLVIHGYPDRVEKTSDGKAVIIDFKTERNRNSHLQDDIDSCLQVLIYAYIVEKAMNVEVDHCEYRMLRYKNGIVTCKYDDEIKEKLTNKLIEFKNAIDKADFSIEPMSKEEEKEKCKYCKFGLICKKVVID